MPAIQLCELPQDALLAKYQEGGGYVDCYFTELPTHVSQAEFIEAFYTTAVFKLERFILAWLVSRPSTDAQARELAEGKISEFAAWTVEGRSANQLLLCDFQGRTRSWLMCVPVANGSTAGTRLYFGSAVVPVVSRQTGRATMGLAFRALLGFHKIYSRALLRAAISRLARSRPVVQ